MTLERGVLIVSTDHDRKLGLRAAIREAGYPVAGEAGTDTEAFALAETERPSAAIVDVDSIGSADGLDVARELASRFNAPTVLLTGDPGADCAAVIEALRAAIGPWRPSVRELH